MSESPPTFKPFDFRNPCRLPMHVEARLTDWQRRACKLLPQKWGEHVGFLSEWDIDSIETVKCRDTELPPHSVVFHAHVAGHVQPTLLYLPGDLSVALVQSVLGATVETLEEPRELTSIEISILEILAELVVNALNEGANGTGNPVVTLAEHDPHPLMVGLYPIEPELIIQRFRVTGPFGESHVQWLWPESMAVELFDEDELAGDGDQSPQLQEHLLRAPFQVTVQLGATELHVSELASLDVGDVLVFNQRISEPLKCIVGDQVLMHAWPATTGKQQSIQIDRYES